MRLAILSNVILENQTFHLPLPDGLHIVLTSLSANMFGASVSADGCQQRLKMILVWQNVTQYSKLSLSLFPSLCLSFSF